MFDEKMQALIAVGASITANCQPCLDYHVAHARERGGDADEINAAIEIGKQVRRGAATKMDQNINRMVSGSSETRAEASCGCR